MSDLLALLLGYALGSIPFGVLVTRLAGAADPRGIGSGNIGATNVLRSGRRGLAAATLAGDALKGTLAVALAARWGDGAELAAAAGAFAGHVAPVWLRFRGGKGVATYAGALLGLSPLAALAFAGTWIAVAAATRYSSLSALVASLAAPLALAGLGRPAAALAFAGLTLALWFLHRANLARLLGGTEGRIGAGKAP